MSQDENMTLVQLPIIEDDKIREILVNPRFLSTVSPDAEGKRSKVTLVSGDKQTILIVAWPFSKFRKQLQEELSGITASWTS